MPYIEDGTLVDSVLLRGDWTRRGQMHYNTDTTLYMSEGELLETIGRLKGMIKRLRDRGSATHDLEWDLCYVQREMDIRAARVDAHRRFQESRGMFFPHTATPTAQS